MCRVGGDEEAGRRKDKVYKAGSRTRECWALKSSYPRGGLETLSGPVTESEEGGREKQTKGTAVIQVIVNGGKGETATHGESEVTGWRRNEDAEERTMN
jgi:hypothetical protein